MEQEKIVEAQNISKSFPGVNALQDVTFDIKTGEVHALCGENGAGKSTLMKILSGSYSHGSFHGRILVKGSVVEFRKPLDSARSGISIVYQELSLVPEMTVAENIFLGREPKIFGIINQQKILKAATEILQRLDLRVSPNAKISHLPLGTRQLVEIARALSQNPHVLVLDEPTSALSKAECENLFCLIKKLRQSGMGIVLVTHKLDEVFSLSDRITIFRDGKKTGTWNTSELNHTQVISLMVGREINNFYPQASEAQKSNPSEIVLEVKNLTLPHPRFPNRNRLENISFNLHKGEILGISGLMGSGRSELLLSLFGALPFRQDRRSDCHIKIFGQARQIKNPKDAIAAGMQLATEDRKKTGLGLDSSIAKNITLASLNIKLSHLNKLSNFGIVNSSQESKSCLEFVRLLKIKAPSINTFVRNLSGGNQQKVVLAKCLMSQPKILFLDEPTRGIDVGAKAEIYSIIHELAKKGMAVVVVSSELPEVLGLCDRILVLCEGRITANLNKTEATEEKLLTAATQFFNPREVYA